MGDKNVDELTKTEWKIIAQVEKGASNREIAETLKPVSYTHLDVYKRQRHYRGPAYFVYFLIRVSKDQRLLSDPEKYIQCAETDIIQPVPGLRHDHGHYPGGN